jgi:hypothetical protein
MNNNFDKIMTKTGEDIDGEEGPSVSKNLCEMISGENVRVEDWQKVLSDTRVNEKVASLANMLEENMEKYNKKRGSMKYVNAKKKYSRRFTAEKKESDTMNCLEPESYIICGHVSHGIKV